MSEPVKKLIAAIIEIPNEHIETRVPCSFTFSRLYAIQLNH